MSTHLLSPEEEAELKAAIAEAESEGKAEEDPPVEAKADPEPEPKTEEPKAEPAKEEPAAKTEAADDEPLPQLDEEKDDAPVQRTQQMVVEGDVGKAQAEIEAIRKYRTDLHKQFREGEIEAEAYQAKLDEANDRLTDLTAEIRLTQAAEQTNLTNTRQLWFDTVDDYRSQYKELQTKSVNAAWDFHIKALKDNAEVQKMLGDGTPPSKVFRYVLKEAHKIVRTELNLGGKPTEVRTSVPPPKSLAGLPQATPAKADADEFADIDSLVGEAAEVALARMSPEKRERYLMRE